MPTAPLIKSFLSCTILANIGPFYINGYASLPGLFITSTLCVIVSGMNTKTSTQTTNLDRVDHALKRMMKKYSVHPDDLTTQRLIVEAMQEGSALAIEIVDEIDASKATQEA